MSKFSKELKAKHDKQEQKRIGDIYAECQKRGCTLHFLKCFDTRMMLYPMKQTECFISSKERGRCIPRKGELDNLIQWQIYLAVYIELRPNDEKTDERKQAFGIVDKYLKNN